MRYLLVIAATLALAACVRMVPDMRPETPAALPPGTVSSAAFAPVTRGVDVDQLGLGDDDARLVIELVLAHPMALGQGWVVLRTELRSSKAHNAL